jgi:hypothetical protein
VTCRGYMLLSSQCVGCRRSLDDLEGKR